MKPFRTLLVCFLVANLLGLGFSSCVDENDYAGGEGVELKFGSDTVSFDTIFTTVGSVTKTLMVYNNEAKAVKIDRVALRSGAESRFAMTVDGERGAVVRDVEVGAKDSIYIFVRVELNPNDQTNPLLVEDAIDFTFNGKTRFVVLQAYGQDAYYHKPSHFLLSQNSSRRGGYDTVWYSLANEGGEACGCVVSGGEIVWKTDKPHVVLGNCVVDSAYTLKLSAGARICMNKSSEFWVYKDGTLRAAGEMSAPVVFESLRKDAHYATAAGQWGMVRFVAGSKDNVFDNVIVRNATIGVLADTCVNSSPTLAMSNTRIENCSYVGLYSRGARLSASNLIVQNCGDYAVALTLGGSYEFVHCTFVNYWRYSTRTKACLLLNDYYVDVAGNVQHRPIGTANFYNCIVYGSLSAEEVEFDFLAAHSSSKHFENCLVKTSKYAADADFVNCVFKDPMFKNSTEGDLSPREGSPAIGAGSGVWSYSVPYDINGTYRPDPPTIGAIEYTKSQSRARRRR